MRVALVQIGNSRGVRLPKSVIEQAALKEDLELEVTEGAVTIRNARTVRQGWAEAALACSRAGEDAFGEWDSATSARL